MEDRVTPAARKRVRLKPEVRTRQILDAALAEFAQHGFDAARMEDIARRAGLSKAGIYAHYSGKEALLEALLGAALTPSAEPRDWLLAGGGNLRAVVEAFVDQLYDRLAAPEVVAVMRLAIAAGGRVPTWSSTGARRSSSRTWPRSRPSCARASRRDSCGRAR